MDVKDWQKYLKGCGNHIMEFGLMGVKQGEATSCWCLSSMPPLVIISPVAFSYFSSWSAIGDYEFCTSECSN